MPLINIHHQIKVVYGELRHERSQKKFQPAASAGKIMVTVLWNVKGVVR
jgi:hypothetical protein